MGCHVAFRDQSKGSGVARTMTGTTVFMGAVVVTTTGVRVGAKVWTTGVAVGTRVTIGVGVGIKVTTGATAAAAACLLLRNNITSTSANTTSNKPTKDTVVVADIVVLTLGNILNKARTGNGTSSIACMEDAVELAVAQARKSAETFRHGAVLLDGRSVIAAGHNRNVNACGLNSIHAEMDAVWKAGRPVLKNVKNVHLVVVRLRRDQDFGLSRPCRACARALARLGVRRVTYTTGDPATPLLTEYISCTASTPATPTTGMRLARTVSTAQTCCIPTC